MSNSANQCPRCGNYILGNYCFSCEIDIRNYLIDDNMPDFFKDIFGDFDKFGDKNE